MPEFSQLATFAVAAILLTLTPGPDIIYVIIRGATQGPKAGFVAAVGLSVGVIGHTLFCIIGLSALLAASALAFTIIKLVGAAYLIYLGVRLLRAGNALDLSDSMDRKALSDIFRQTIIMNLINPKVALFFLAFLPQFVDPAAGPVAFQFAVLGFIFMSVALVIMGGAGLAGGQVWNLLKNNRRVSRWSHWTAGLVLVGLGFRLAIEGRN